MNDTTTKTPGWLARAEAEVAAIDAARRAARTQANEGLALAINDALAELGITPATPAWVNDDGSLLPAELVPPDPRRGKWGVRAEWDEDDGAIRLVAIDPHPDAAFRPHRADLLRSPIDVVRLRNDGPPSQTPAPPAPSRPSADALAITAAIHTLTAALDGLIETINRK